jgi:outer membrane protein TolC
VIPFILAMGAFLGEPASASAAGALQPLTFDIPASSSTVPGVVYIMPQLDKPQAKLSWEDCVKIALKNEPSLRAAWKTQQEQLASYYNSYNGFLPNVQLSDTYNKFQGLAGVSYSQGFVANFPYEAQGAASMNIFSYSALASIWSARALWLSSIAGRRGASQALRYNLKVAFSNLLYSQSSINVNWMIQDLWHKNYEMIYLRYRSGQESKGNMLVMRGLFLNALEGYYQALRNLRKNQKALAQYLGWGDFRPLEIDASFPAAYQVRSLPDDAALDKVLENRPDVATQKAAVKSAEASLSQTRSLLIPEAKVTGNYSQLGAEFSHQDAQSNYSVVGMVSFPLLSGGLTSAWYQIKSAMKARDAAVQQLRTVEYAARQDLESTWSTFASAQDQQINQLNLLKAWRQRNAEDDILYQAGLMVFDIWEPIVAQRLSQEIIYLQAENTALQQEANWERALGKELGQ